MPSILPFQTIVMFSYWWISWKCVNAVIIGGVLWCLSYQVAYIEGRKTTQSMTTTP